MFERYLSAREAEFGRIPAERQRLLERLSGFIEGRTVAGEPARLTFICTHNSRRSHIAQTFALAAAHRFGIDGVQVFSGGTEVTAFNPAAVESLRRTGLPIRIAVGGDNPTYEVGTGEAWPSILARSKRFDDGMNPSEGFCAVMTCTDASDACPVVPGADLRLSIPYEDPKAFDGTPHEGEQYDERCRQIAREMLYVCSRVR